MLTEGLLTSLTPLSSGLAGRSVETEASWSFRDASACVNSISSTRPVIRCRDAAHYSLDGVDVQQPSVISVPARPEIGTHVQGSLIVENDDIACLDIEAMNDRAVVKRTRHLVDRRTGGRIRATRRILPVRTEPTRPKIRRAGLQSSAAGVPQTRQTLRALPESSAVP